MKLVLISAQSHRPGINNIGDVVSWHDDDVVLGPAYDTFEIVEIKNMTCAEFIAKTGLILPVATRATRVNAPQNQWTIASPEILRVYKDGTQWKEIAEPPKYQMQVDKSELNKLTADSDTETKLKALETAIISNVKSDKNQTVIDIYDPATVK